MLVNKIWLKVPLVAIEFAIPAKYNLSEHPKLGNMHESSTLL